MATRIFETYDEPVQLAQRSPASFVGRILFCGWASLVSVTPAFAAAYSALQVTRFFSSLKNAENATTPNVFAHIHSINTPMVVVLGISAFLALGFALVLVIEPTRRLDSVGLPFSISVPILAALPALLLWFAETTTIDGFSGKLTDTTIASTAQTVGLLLFSAMVSGLLVPGAAFVFSIISLCIPIESRTDELSWNRVVVWAVTGTLLLVFAGAYLVVV